MRRYEVRMLNGEVYHINARAAQLAVNHVYSFCGERNKIVEVVRIGSSGKRVNCIWK